MNRSIKKIRFLFIGMLAFLCAFIAGSLISEKERQLDNITPKVQRVVSAKEELLSSWVHERKIPHVDNEAIKSYFSLSILKNLEKNDLALFFFINDSLALWTSNEVPVDEFFNPELFSDPFVHLPNGWYLCQTHFIDNFKILGLALIKHSYKFQNDYLQNDFTPNALLPDEVDITFEETSHPIYAKNGAFLFGLKSSDKLPLSNTTGFLLFSSFIGFVFLFLLWLKMFLPLLFKTNHHLAILLFILIVVAFRVILFFHLPAILTNTVVFEPFYYASSSLNPSLGDAFLSLLCIVLIVWTILNPKTSSSVVRKKKKYDFLLAVFFILLANGMLYFYLSFLKYFVQDSNFYLITDNILAEDITFIVSLLFLCMVFMLTYLVYWKLCDIANSFTHSSSKLIGAAIIGLLLLWCGCFFLSAERKCILFIFPTILFLIYLVVNVKGLYQNSVAMLLLAPAVFAIFSTFQILHYTLEKERDYDKILLENLSIDESPFIEHLFEKAKEKIRVDTVLQSIVEKGASSKEKLCSYLKNTYFARQGEAYDVNLHICFSEEERSAYQSEFEKKLQKHARTTQIEDLYITTPALAQNNLYCFKPIVLKSGLNDTVLLYVDFVEKDYLRSVGFAMLHLDGNAFERYTDVRQYCFARYVDKRLVRSQGEYFYPAKLPNRAVTSPLTFKSYHRNGYEHLVYTTENPQVVWILSKRDIQFESKLRSLFYLFIAFFLFRLCTYPIDGLHFVFFDKKNFRRRFQFVLIILIVIPFFIVGILFAYYFTKTNNQKDNASLSEKSSYVIAYFQEYYKTTDVLQENSYPNLINKVVWCADVHKCDISVFSTEGKLLASSYMQIYKDGFIAPLLNPIALKSLNDEILFVSSYEKIGKKQYITSYSPLKNERNKTIAYISSSSFLDPSSPYSAIFPFLLDYVYLYFIITLISIMILSFATKRFMRPLQVIRQRMRSLSLGRKNEKIKANRTDEFGDLIRSYNLMVDKLEENAYLLAKSEREGIWRSIAKRVAHEIKNPLTPMILSIQQLQRAWNDQSPEFDKRIKKTTLLLTEQIKILSAVVDEFSDLAGKSQSVTEKVDLVEIIQKVILLYEDFQNVQFTLNFDKDETYEVIACIEFFIKFKNAL